MKHISLSRKLNHFILFLSVLVLTGCSRSCSSTDFLKRIPADADVVVVGDVESVVKSLGGELKGSDLKLPSYLTSELDKELDKIQETLEALKASGVDAKKVAIAVNYKDYQPIVVFKIDDKKKLKKFLESEDFEADDEEDGITFYCKNINYEWGAYSSSCVAVYKGFGYFADRVYDSETKNKARSIVNRFIDSAKEESYASTKMGDYVASAKTVGVAIKFPKELKKDDEIPADLRKILGGYIGIQADLDGDELKMKFKITDEEGKTPDMSFLSKYVDYKKRINDKALKYLDKDQAIVEAMSLKEFKFSRITDNLNLSTYEKAQFNAVEPYLKKIDGTVVIGMGITNGLESVKSLTKSKDITENISFTAVVETKDGGAKKIMNDLKELIENNADVTKNGEGYKVSVKGETFYMTAEDDFFILSTSAIKKSDANPALNLMDFDDFNLAYALVFTKDNPLMKDLEIKNNVSLTGGFNFEDCEGEIVLKVTGADKAGILENIARMVIGIYNNRQEIQSKLNSISGFANKYEYDSYSDYENYDYDQPYDFDMTAPNTQPAVEGDYEEYDGWG